MLGYAAVDRITPAAICDREELLAGLTSLSLERGTPIQER
jgi:hypothetical protein